MTVRISRPFLYGSRQLFAVSCKILVILLN